MEVVTVLAIICPITGGFWRSLNFLYWWDLPSGLCWEELPVRTSGLYNTDTVLQPIWVQGNTTKTAYAGAISLKTVVKATTLWKKKPGKSNKFQKVSQRTIISSQSFLPRWGISAFLVPPGCAVAAQDLQASSLFQSFCHWFPALLSSPLPSASPGSAAVAQKKSTSIFPAWLTSQATEYIAELRKGWDKHSPTARESFYLLLSLFIFTYKHYSTRNS